MEAFGHHMRRRLGINPVNVNQLTASNCFSIIFEPRVSPANISAKDEETNSIEIYKSTILLRMSILAYSKSISQNRLTNIFAGVTSHHL